MENARPLDLEEVYYATGVTFEDSFLHTMEDTLVLLDEEDRVYAIGGFPKGHVVWMLCTKRVEENKILFLRSVKSIFKEFIDKKDWLYNYVWMGNELHVKWLKWMGAEFKEPLYRGIDNQPFRLFYFEKEVSK